MPSPVFQIPLFVLPSLRRRHPDKPAVISVNMVGVFQLAGLQTEPGLAGGPRQPVQKSFKIQGLPTSGIVGRASPYRRHRHRTSALCSVFKTDPGNKGGI